MNSKNAPIIGALFQTAHDDGTLSDAGLKALSIPDLGSQIQAGLGISVDDVAASEVILVTMLIDDSGSIRFAGNSEFVRDGHNGALQALEGSKQRDGILAHTRFLNSATVFPFTPLPSAARLDTTNYNATGSTPLHKESVVALGTVLAKAKQFEDNGVAVRTVTLIVTDGADNASGRTTAKHVRAIVTDMLKAETHIVAGMGVDDGCGTDFRQVFADMGIPDTWILTPKNTPSDIRRAFALFSQSAVRASQTSAAFSQTAAGGFGTP